MSETNDSARLQNVLAVLSEWLSGAHEWSLEPVWLRDWMEGDCQAMKEANAAIHKRAALTQPTEEKP